MLKALQSELNEKVTTENLLDPDILELSQKLDPEVNKVMRKELNRWLDQK
jgi:hypothetical protein